MAPLLEAEVKKAVEKFVVLNLREIYHEFGEYDFKVILNERFFKNGHGAEVTMRDSAGNPMKYEAKVWGRKIVCKFTVDDNVAEGRSHVSLAIKNEKGDLVDGRLSFWVIK